MVSIQKNPKLPYTHNLIITDKLLSLLSSVVDGVNLINVF